MRTNDLVLISLIESVLGEAGVMFLVADQNMSVLEGSLGILPRRVLVAEEDQLQARRLLVEAGVTEGQLSRLEGE